MGELLKLFINIQNFNEINLEVQKDTMLWIFVPIKNVCLYLGKIIFVVVIYN